VSVPLLEGTGGTARSDSASPDQHFSVTEMGTTSTSSESGASRSPSGSNRRDLLTLHIGSGHTVAQEDLELLLVVVQTLLLATWAYSEVVK
jgi:hypothetical protein